MSLYFYGGLAFGGLVLYRFASGRRPSLPPGPRKLPIVGNAFDFPSSSIWETFTNWKEQYGDIVYLSLFGQPVIILNTTAATGELMQKRAANYSNRPRLMLRDELMGWGWTITTNSGERHRKMRSMAQKYFVHQVKQYYGIQTDEARIFGKRILASPDRFDEHITLFAASTMLRIGYVYRVNSVDDSLLTIINKALMYSAINSSLVDIFPILRFWPKWLPGGSFHRLAREGKAIMEEMRDVPFEQVKMQWAVGTAAPCFVTTLLEGIDSSSSKEDQETMIRDSVGTMYAAGSHSTSSTVRTFILAMILFPELQTRAQEEVDRITGRQRLPAMDDSKDMPFVNALILDVLRWNCVAPTAFAHMSISDDEYMGYHIPAGSIVYGNIWAITRDPERFPDPEKVDPTRYLGPNGKELAEVVNNVFGWGRRLCPGKEMAEGSIFISITTFLATFTVTKPRDKTGREHDPEVRWSPAFIRELLPFECTITPRNSVLAEQLTQY